MREDPEIDDVDAYVKRVRVDHAMHWFAILVTGGYGWQLYGFLAGVGVIIALVALISLTNAVLLVKTGSFRLIRWNRWSWVIGMYLLLMLSAAESCQQSPDGLFTDCHSIWR